MWVTFVIMPVPGNTGCLIFMNSTYINVATWVTNICFVFTLLMPLIRQPDNECKLKKRVWFDHFFRYISHCFYSCKTQFRISYYYCSSMNTCQIGIKKALKLNFLSNIKITTLNIILHRNRIMNLIYFIISNHLIGNDFLSDLRARHFHFFYDCLFSKMVNSTEHFY